MNDTELEADYQSRMKSGNLTMNEVTSGVADYKSKKKKKKAKLVGPKPTVKVTAGLAGTQTREQRLMESMNAQINKRKAFAGGLKTIAGAVTR